MDLLMKHEFEGVNLIKRRWRTRQTNQMTPACISTKEASVVTETYCSTY